MRCDLHYARHWVRTGLALEQPGIRGPASTEPNPRCNPAVPDPQPWSSIFIAASSASGSSATGYNNAPHCRHSGALRSRLHGRLLSLSALRCAKPGLYCTVNWYSTNVSRYLADCATGCVLIKCVSTAWSVQRTNGNPNRKCL